MEKMSRRTFLKAGTVATAALAVAPADTLAKSKKSATPKKKILKVLGVGVGGRGHNDINGVCRDGKELYPDVEFI